MTVSSFLFQSFQIAPETRNSKQKAASTRHTRSKGGGLSCEITRTCARVFHLTTGTFNLVVKDRIAFRLSGAPSVQTGSHESESVCPRNPSNISRAAEQCQPAETTGFPPDLHSRGAPTGRPRTGMSAPHRSSFERSVTRSSAYKGYAVFGAGRSGRV
jgi:hypothetical protein